MPRNKTITIATPKGPREVTGRATPCPGLAITGERGAYRLTHVPSGYLLWRGNPHATVAHIRNSMMLATMSVMVFKPYAYPGTLADWTAEKDALRHGACLAWMQAFRSHVEMATVAQMP